MLKKIAIEHVRLGMHVHELCGAWLDHPFWKKRFVLDDPADLQKLRASGVREAWIDVSRGCDVAPSPGPTPPPASPPPALPAAPVQTAAPRIELAAE